MSGPVLRHLLAMRRIAMLKWALAAALVLLLCQLAPMRLRTKSQPFQAVSSHQLTPDSDHNNSSTTHPLDFAEYDTLYNNVTITITICGNSSLEQGITALKSALIFSQVHIHFVIMTDPAMFDYISEKLESFYVKRSSFSYEMHTVEYPNKNTRQMWRKLFKQCASERLFLPNILKHIDSVLYIDTDVIFLSPVEEAWRHFSKMNSSHIAAMSSESEDFSNNWYHRFAKHPYYGSYGLNSGVMLMNLTRMRQFSWQDKLEPTLLKYKSKIVWGDQDIINIIFHYNRGKMYLFGCNWNYRPDHCVYTSVCKSAEQEGVKIVHGSRGAFLNDKQAVFKALYTAVDQFSFEQHSPQDLVEKFQSLLSLSNSSSNCAKVSHLFWKSIVGQTR